MLLGVPEVAPHYQLVVERPGTMDELTILCESSNSSDELRHRVQYALREATGLHMIVHILDPGGVPRSEGKAVRVIDKRQ